nr:UBN2_2 domain-containing protein [Tanacetum cinerariifolium]
MTLNAKKYLSSAEEQFKGTSKAHSSTSILKMCTTKYDGVSSVREHIMMMSDMANKLKGMDMEISEGETKNDQTVAIYVQEEERLKVEKLDVVHVAATNSDKRKGSWKGKSSSKDNSTLNKFSKTGASTSLFQGGPKCKFCHKKMHTQKGCLKSKECSPVSSHKILDISVSGVRCGFEAVIACEADGDLVVVVCLGDGNGNGA